MSKINLGTGFDIRHANPLDWHTAAPLNTRGYSIFEEVEFNEVKEVFQDSVTFHHINSIREFENSILAKANKNSAFSSFNLPREFQLYTTDFDNQLLIFLDGSVQLSSRKISSDKLSASFRDNVERLGMDISPRGFIDRFGSHYIKSITRGGRYLVSFTLNKRDFVNSPYAKFPFLHEVNNAIEQVLNSGLYSNPYIHLSPPKILTKGGNRETLQYGDWVNSVTKNPVAVDVDFASVASLLTPQNFPQDPSIDSKRALLQEAVDQASNESMEFKSTKQQSTFYKKYALLFIQRIETLEKKSMGQQPEEIPYAGDLFYGAFAKDGAMIKTAPVMSYGDINTNTLITDEKIKLDKPLEFMVAPEDLDGAYVSIWDDTKKLVKGKDRTTLRVSGSKEAQTKVAEALIAPIKKTIEVKTIDNDVFTVTYTLQKKELETFANLHNKYSTPLESQWISAAARGDSTQLIELYRQDNKKYINGLFKAVLQNNNDTSLLNLLCNLGFRPTTADLEIAFDPQYFTKDKALTLLERGAPPLNNMIYKAVAYRAPQVITALLREGATPVNNDLEFAISLQDYDILKALTVFDYTGYSFTSSDLFVAAQSGDLDLVNTFISKGATGNAAVLQAALDTENQKIIDTVIHHTPYTDEIIVLALSQNNPALLQHYLELSIQDLPQPLLAEQIAKNNLTLLKIILDHRDQADEILDISINKNNAETALLALKKGGQSNNLMQLALDTESQDLLQYILKNRDYMPGQALTIALNMENTGIADEILNANKDMEITQEHIFKTIENGYGDLLRSMLGKTQIDLNPSIYLALDKKRVDIAEFLIDKVKDIDVDLLLYASQKQYPELKMLIAKSGYSPSALLQAAIENEEINLARALLDLQVSPTIENLETAQNKQNEDLFSLLIRESDGNILKGKMLTVAIRAFHNKVVSALLNKNVDPDTGLDTALYYKNTEALKLLLDAGVTASNEVVLATIKNNNIEATRVLLEYNKTFCSSMLATTAMIMICANYEDVDIELINLLTSHGMDVNSRNSMGETVLHIASTGNNTKKPLVEKLLNLGADPSLKTSRGQTPSDYASDREILRLLSSALK
tara:strand:- start:294 stop:3563 length:3270 start_codon:yes stop_codon:yes gene_type:complete